jgi:hypothetical protein
MKIENPAEKYIKQAKLLSKDEAEHVFSRMRKRIFRLWRDKGAMPEEAVALQLEYEDIQLEEWRKKMAKMQARAKT